MNTGGYNPTWEIFDINRFCVPGYLLVAVTPAKRFCNVCMWYASLKNNEFVHNTSFYLYSTPSGVCGWQVRYACARMTPIAFLQQLYSLDTLDTRFTTSARTPLKAANEDPARTVKPEVEKLLTTLPTGASPSRWRTPEFYVYAVVFVVCVPQMFKAVVDVSQCKCRLAQEI